ncbi:DUF3857 domain-containing protein [Flavitalea flava]
MRFYTKHLSALRKILPAVTAVLIHSSLCAQMDPAKYKERAAVVRQEIWAWNIPAFANRKIPAEYANESSVILARRAEIDADTKKKIFSSRSFYYNSTVRELVKINDKASLEEYSQISYRQFKKLNSWINGSMTSFVGARIIKPDGTMKEVNIDESVLTGTGIKDQQRKLAISDLQVGDILDLFIRVEEFSQTIKEPERMNFVFGDDHPILDYSIHCDIGDKYAVEYRSINKAPEAKQSFTEDKDLILDLAMKNIPAVPTDLWMSQFRQLPIFRLNVLTGGTSGRAKGEVVKDVPLEDVIGKIYTGTSYPDPYAVAAYKKKVAVILHNFKQFNKLPDDSLAYLIFYAYRFARYYNLTSSDLEVGEDRNSMDINNYDYLIYLQKVLDAHKIRSQFVVMPSKYGPGINQIMGVGDLSVMLRVDLEKPGTPYKSLYFSNVDMFTYPGYVPGYLEGQPCPDVRPKTYKHDAAVDLLAKTPLSNAADNIHQEDLQISMEGADLQLLRVKRHTVLTGKMKSDEQIRLLNFEDCYEMERNSLLVEKSIMDDLKKVRRSKNVSEDYATALDKARASLKDRFKAEISSEFEQDPKELFSWKVENPGLRHNAPDLVYSTEFTVDALVQRAGNNLLLNIGKVVNSPIKLRPSQRTRKVDIYMAYARTLDCSVSFIIPAGYTVQGADKLGKILENDCGSVTTSAQIQGNKLIVHFKRVYKHGIEPADKWPQLLAILDASTDFAGQKVLLKKG